MRGKAKAVTLEEDSTSPDHTGLMLLKDGERKVVCKIFNNTLLYSLTICSLVIRFLSEKVVKVIKEFEC